MVVRCFSAISSSSAACTTRSDSLSSADVASSRRSTDGRLMIARAIATRCFCPPDSFPPPAPTWVLYPSLRSRVTNSCAFAIFAAATTSSSDTPSLP
mmetsp:Transcript_19677/g.49149  ORF Transcript_19677/g.49149 Transcript_19677/m.49149 type:complete len:97 (-) Transcript_19677:1416-1706(-)